jgi:hypothetical protein
VSDTSLVFNLLAKDTSVSRTLNAVKNAFTSAGKQAETAMSKADDAVKKLERELDKAEAKIESLDSASAKAAIAAEGAQLKLAAAQAKHNGLVEKAKGLAEQQAAAIKRVELAEAAVGAAAAKSAAEQKAAAKELEAAKRAQLVLAEKETALTEQQAAALNRVKAAELAAASAAERASSQNTARKRAIAEVDRLREAIEEAKRSNDDLGQGGGRLGSLISMFSQGASSVASFASSASSAGGGVGILTVAILGAVSALFTLGPAIAVAAGAIGSLPGIISGAAAAFGTLKLGLFGLSSEYQRLTSASGGGGGGAAKAARDFTAQQRAVEAAVKAVTRAERDLRDAQRDALRAQQEINDAREEASDRLRDQAMDLEDAKISEAESVDELKAAELELNAARGANDPTRLAEAERAYLKAELAVRRAKARTEELTEANAENAKKGVEGSDEVVAAKERERAATRRVTDAEEARAEAIQRVADSQKALADAQKQAASGGGGGGGQQITKLAPSARAFLDTILKLRPAMEDLRLDVQERLFSGLADKLERFADVWKGPLTKTLGSFADTFNKIAKDFFDSASKKTFIDNITAGADSARKMLGRIGEAVAGPLLDAFGRLARASGPFLERLGILIGRTIEKFSEWIKKADESGKLQEFFDGAAKTLEKVWVVTEDIVEVMGKFIAIIYPDAKSGGDSVLDGAHVTLEKISAWLDRPENQQKIKDIINQVKSLVGWFGRAADKVGSWYQAASNTYNRIRHGGEVLLGWVRNLPGRISRAASGMWNGFREAFRSALNWIIGKWNGLSFSLPSVSFLGQQIGGGRVGMPHVNYLAEGGIARARPGGHLAVIGEGGEDEVVAPLSKLSQMSRPSGPQHLDVTVKLDFGTSELGQLMAKTVRTQPAVAAEMGKYIKVRVTA